MSVKVTQYQDGISGATVIVENHEYLKDNDPKKYVIKVEVGEATFRMTVHEWVALETGVHNMLVEAGCVIYMDVSELTGSDAISDTESDEETL